MSFGDIDNYICNLIEEEENAKGKNRVLSNPYHKNWIMVDIFSQTHEWL